MSGIIDREEASDIDSALADSDLQGFEDLINAQPFVAKHISAWAYNSAAGSAPPIRWMPMGDSLSTGLAMSPKMGLAGVIGLQSYNRTGTFVLHSQSTTPRYDYWINGQALTLSIGATSEYTVGGSATGNIRGDQACVAYIKGPGRGSFNLEYQANGTGAWTSLGTIDTSNASTIGGYSTFNLPASSSPYYRLRINTVITGDVTICLTGIYNTNAAGVIDMSTVASVGGIDLSHFLTTPSAVFTPIWTGLAPNVIFSCWADAASSWDSGGDFRTFYALATAAHAATDWIQISRNPFSDASEATIIAAQNTAQRAWAASAGQSFVNGYSLFRDYATANAKGLMSDVTHLNTAGIYFRNRHLWAVIPVNTYELGGFGQSFAGSVPYDGNIAGISGNITTVPLTFNRSISLEGASGGVLYTYDAADPLNGAKVTYYRTSAERQTFGRGSSVGGYFDYGSGLIGFYAGGSNWALGSTSVRWKPFFAETNINGAHILVPDALSGAGAIPVTTPTTALTTSGVAQALTLANGTNGQVKTIVHDVDGGSAVLTPTTKTGFSTITFTNAGDTVTLQYFTTRGWMVIGSFGAVIA